MLVDNTPDGGVVVVVGGGKGGAVGRFPLLICEQILAWDGGRALPLGFR